MKKPLVIMISLVGTMAVLLAAGVGVYLYMKQGKSVPGPTVLTAAQARALQVDLPQVTTNLKSSGLIQFTLTLQAADKTVKQEITDQEPDIQDAINQTMRQFSSDSLKTQQGYLDLKSAILAAVNHVLLNGRITAVYLSQVVVQ